MAVGASLLREFLRAVRWIANTLGNAVGRKQTYTDGFRVAIEQLDDQRGGWPRFGADRMLYDQ